jgi:hypothetical protein
VLTTGFPFASVLQQTVDPLSHLLMREIFAALQPCFAELDSFDKTSFLGEIAADRLLRKRPRVATPLTGKFRELELLFRREVNFHKPESKCAIPDLSMGPRG